MTAPRIASVTDYSRLLVAERVRHDAALADIHATYERWQAKCKHRERQQVAGVWLCARCGAAMGTKV
jgi:hypothetical protein